MALAVVYLVAPSGAGGALGSLQNDGANDFAIGDFERANGGHTGFEAYSDPNGANPFGHLSSTFDNNSTGGTGTIHQRYDVICLAVSGNEAAIGLVPTDSPPDNAATAPRVLVVWDSGLPGGAGDEYAFTTLLKKVPTDCARWLGRFKGGFAPISGDIVVHDEP